MELEAVFIATGKTVEVGTALTSNVSGRTYYYMGVDAPNKIRVLDSNGIGRTFYATSVFGISTK